MVGRAFRAPADRVVAGSGNRPVMTHFNGHGLDRPISCSSFYKLPSSCAAAELDSLLVQDVLEGEEESSSENALSDLGCDAYMWFHEGLG